MYKNILIIGFGNMGKSHLKSFLISKKKYKIHIYDLKSVVDREIKNFSNKINFLSKFPKKKNYDLAILATSSKVRYKLLMKLLNYNKIKNIILEKFIFDKIHNYKKFDKYLKSNISLKINVNTWGDYLYKNLRIQKSIINYRNIKIIVPDGTMLTNYIHYSDFYLRNQKKIKIKTNFKKIINSKRKGYHEALGKIQIKSNKNQMEINTNKNIKYHTIYIDKIYKIIVDYKKKFVVYKNNKIIQKINFPYAFKFSEKNFLSINTNNKKNRLNNYDKISYLSSIFLENLKIYKKRKDIIIT
jgi:hypothetical protein